MKEQIASLLIVAALIVGVGIGYFGNTATSRMTTETVIKTYTMTTTLPEESGVERCTVTQYAVWMYGQTQSSSTSYGLRTVGNSFLPYETTTSPEQTVGFVTSTDTTYTGTLTGAIALWNSTTCTFISG
ncbi:MAG: hypothetical protein ABSB53_01840 [Nitrososphaerales archaeon]